MDEPIEYVCFTVNAKLNDLYHLDHLLYINGYNFGIDTCRRLLFVSVDDTSCVKTILKDNQIEYKEKHIKR